jgi:hypothetical protein
LAKSLRVGGIVYDVGLNFKPLERDLAKARKMLDAFSREAAKKSGGSSGGSGPRPTGGGGAGVGALAGSLTIGLRPVSGALDKMRSELTRIADAQLDALRAIARNTGRAAGSLRSGDMASLDAFRVSRRSRTLAKAGANFEAAGFGFGSGLRGAGNRGGVLPADVAFQGGGRQGAMPKVNALAAATGRAAQVARTLAGAWHLADAAVQSFSLRPIGRQIDRIQNSTYTLRKTLSITFSAAVAPIRMAATALGLMRRESTLTATAVAKVGDAARGIAAPITGPMGWLKSALPAIGAGLAAAFVGKGVMAASDLNETLNKTRTTFGDTSEEVVKFADGMADRFGLVKQTVLDVSSGFGLLLRGANIGGAELTKMSTTLASLSANMQSYFNEDIGETSRALAAAFRNQYEPISRYGVLLTAEIVKQRAFAMGLAASTDEVSQQARAMAAYSIILEKLAPVENDLVNTGNEVANLWREMTGRIENFQTELGQALLPAFRELLLLFNDLMSKSTPLGDSIKEAFATVGEFAKNMVHTARQMLANWEPAIQVMRLWIEDLLTDINEMFGWMADNLPAMFKDVGLHLYAAVMDGVGSAMEKIEDWLRSLGMEPQGAFGGSGAFRMAAEDFRAQARANTWSGFNPTKENSFAISELMKQITATQVRGDQPPGAAPVQRGNAGEGIPLPEDAAGGKRDRGSIGQLLGVSEFLSKLQESASDKEAKKLQRENNESLKAIRAVLEKGQRGAGNPDALALA